VLQNEVENRTTNNLMRFAAFPNISKTVDLLINKRAVGTHTSKNCQKAYQIRFHFVLSFPFTGGGACTACGTLDVHCPHTLTMKNEERPCGVTTLEAHFISNVDNGTVREIQ